jgi:hypothetical protein
MKRTQIDNNDTITKRLRPANSSINTNDHFEKVEKKFNEAFKSKKYVFFDLVY